MLKFILISDTKRVRDELTHALTETGVAHALILDGAAPDPENRGGSAANLYLELGIPFSVCDPLTETLPDLSGFDAVHMSGGNPFRLMKGAVRTDLKARMTERSESGDLLVCGASAGAMVLGTDISHARILQPDLGMANAGFGWIDGQIMPHLDMNGKYGDIIRAHVGEHPDAPWVLLNETTFLAIPEIPEPQASFSF